MRWNRFGEAYVPILRGSLTAQNYYTGEWAYLRSVCIYCHTPGFCSAANEIMDCCISCYGHVRIRRKTSEALLLQRLANEKFNIFTQSPFLYRWHKMEQFSGETVTLFVVKARLNKESPYKLLRSTLFSPGRTDQ